MIAGSRPSLSSRDNVYLLTWVLWYVKRATLPYMCGRVADFGRTFTVCSAPFSLVQIVPQQSSYIVERLGRFHKKLESGLHLLIPLIDKVAYVHNLKEQAIPVANQKAITRDNTVVDIDGVLYMRIVDAEKASYGVSNAILAVMQLAQTTMRSELGKISLVSVVPSCVCRSHSVATSLTFVTFR